MKLDPKEKARRARVRLIAKLDKVAAERWQYIYENYRVGQHAFQLMRSTVSGSRARLPREEMESVAQFECPMTDDDREYYRTHKQMPQSYLDKMAAAVAETRLFWRRMQATTPPWARKALKVQRS